MDNFGTWIVNFGKQYIIDPFLQFSFPGDLLDIVMLTALFYWIYSFIKNRRAGKLAIGVVLVLVAYGVSDILNMEAFHNIITAVVSVGIVIIVIIFQPELRDVLEKIGSTLFGLRALGEKEQAELTNTINAVVDMAIEIAKAENKGALVVIEGTTKLGDYIDKGCKLDAVVSADLLGNIFVDSTPLHDGAVIISNNRIAAACCDLPLTNNKEDLKDRGTRHEAAVGITEFCNDCVVVVVSEEKHRISLANGGQIRLDYNESQGVLFNEERQKEIKTELRQDLFHLLTNLSAEEATDIVRRNAEKENKRMLKEAQQMRRNAEKKLIHRARRNIEKAKPAKTAEQESAKKENTDKSSEN